MNKKRIYVQTEKDYGQWLKEKRSGNQNLKTRGERGTRGGQYRGTSGRGRQQPSSVKGPKMQEDKREEKKMKGNKAQTHHEAGQYDEASGRTGAYKEEKEELKICLEVEEKPKLKTYIMKKHLYPYMWEILGKKNCSFQLQEDENHNFIVETTMNSSSEVGEIENIVKKLKYSMREVDIEQTDLNALVVLQKVEKYRKAYNVSIQFAQPSLHNPNGSYKIEGLDRANVDTVYRKLHKMQKPIFTHN